MNRITITLLCLAPVLLCACGSDSKKKKSSKEQTLGQRLDRPDITKVSSFQKYMDASSQGKGKTIGSKWQTQSHHAADFDGTQSVKGLNAYKTSDAKGFSESKYGQSSFSESSKASKLGSQGFDAATSRDASRSAREGRSFFRDGGKDFGTDSALPVSQQVGRDPKIIEKRPFDDLSKTYSEEDIKRLLGRP